MSNVSVLPQPKRSCVSAYMNHMKGRTLTGLMSEDGDYCGKDVGYSAATAPFHVPADSMLPQVGRNFSLPRYRSVKVLQAGHYFYIGDIMKQQSNLTSEVEYVCLI